MIKIAICDDDNLVCSELESKIFLYSNENFVKIECDIYNSVEALFQSLAKECYDLIFFDIEFPNQSGVLDGECIRKELKDEKTQIVFISWHKEYALKLFKINVLDFIVKPIASSDVARVLDTLIAINKTSGNVFKYSIGKDIYSVELSDILYFQSYGRKVCISMINGKSDYFYGKITDVYNELKEFCFLYVHNRYLVNYPHIECFRYEYIILNNNMQIPISQSKRKEIRNLLLEIVNVDNNVYLNKTNMLL